MKQQTKRLERGRRQHPRVEHLLRALEKRVDSFSPSLPSASDRAEDACLVLGKNQKKMVFPGEEELNLNGTWPQDQSSRLKRGRVRRD